MPAKANVKNQRSFFEVILQPLMNHAKNGEVTLLFADASHFVMGCDFMGYIYGKVRRFIKTYSGRKRYNVLGALNFITKKVTTVTNDTYITSAQICLLLRKIAAEYVGKPIFMVLDNASYQRCKIVEDLALELGIHLIFIPPYSPNLNLIERLWKYVKGKLRTKYYDKFDEFQTTIDSILYDADHNDKTVIDKLIDKGL